MRPPWSVRGTRCEERERQRGLWGLPGMGGTRLRCPSTAWAPRTKPPAHKAAQFGEQMSQVVLSGEGTVAVGTAESTPAGRALGSPVPGGGRPGPSLQKQEAGPGGLLVHAHPETPGGRLSVQSGGVNQEGAVVLLAGLFPGWREPEAGRGRGGRRWAEGPGAFREERRPGRAQVRSEPGGEGGLSRPPLGARDKSLVPPPAEPGACPAVLPAVPGGPRGSRKCGRQALPAAAPLRPAEVARYAAAGSGTREGATTRTTLRVARTDVKGRRTPQRNERARGAGGE